VGDDYLRQTNTLIRHYLHTDPDKLTDEKWAMMAKDVEWLIKFLNPKD
jgi:hypothetical protein